jgi:hypothetical protein
MAMYGTSFVATNITTSQHSYDEESRSAVGSCRDFSLRLYTNPLHHAQGAVLDIVYGVEPVSWASMNRRQLNWTWMYLYEMVHQSYLRPCVSWSSLHMLSSEGRNRYNKYIEKKKKPGVG